MFGVPKELPDLRIGEIPIKLEVNRFSQTPLDVKVFVWDTRRDKYFLIVKVVANEKLCSSKRTFSDVPKLLIVGLEGTSKTVLKLNPILNRLESFESSGVWLTFVGKITGE